MPSKRSRSPQRLARQIGEISVAAPQVVAHRLTRMALAGPRPGARDRREFHGMAHEKVLAFWQSWFAMGWSMVTAGQKAWLAMLQGARMPAFDVSQMLVSGLAPVHRKATANARRLARTPVR